jgi:hypothetical protein
MPTSRRSFLFGSRSAPSSWGQFCARLARTAQGQTSWDVDETIKIARLVPSRDKDVWHALALCKEYGVQIWLDGPPLRSPQHEQAILLVEPGSAWARLESTNAHLPHQDVWRVDAGCTVAQLQTSGFDWLRQVDPAWSIARWLASELASVWTPGEGSDSHVLQASVLLADGTTAVLGEFGTKAKRPLQSISVQKMVPHLFELSRSPIAQAMMACSRWPAPYRLDALTPRSTDDVNLARILTGHGGSLVWLWAVWLVRDTELARRSVAHQPVHQSLDSDALDAFNRQVKQAFDPSNVFAPIRPTKGLESGSL